MKKYASLIIIAICAAGALADEEVGEKAVPADGFAPIKNSIGMTLVPIPSGAFQMGSSDREPGRNNNEGQVEVTISKPFLISDTEVTQEQWTEVMGNSPWEGAVSNSFAKKGPRFPAVDITWDDAVAFCKELTILEREAQSHVFCGIAGRIFLADPLSEPLNCSPAGGGKPLADDPPFKGASWLLLVVPVVSNSSRLTAAIACGLSD